MSIKNYLDEKIGERFEKDVNKTFDNRATYYEVHNMPMSDFEAKLIRKESELTVLDRFPYNVLKRFF